MTMAIAVSWPPDGRRRGGGPTGRIWVGGSGAAIHVVWDQSGGGGTVEVTGAGPGAGLAGHVGASSAAGPPAGHVGASAVAGPPGKEFPVHTSPSQYRKCPVSHGSGYQPGGTPWVTPRGC